MNFASTMMFFSLLVPAKGWFPPDQPIEVAVRASGEYTLMMSEFTGRWIDPEISADVVGDKTVDLRKLFPESTHAGTYVLYAQKRGATSKSDFVGTPVVIEARVDERRGAPPGPMVVKLEPLCYAIMSTDKGDMTLAFYYDVAPNTVDNFLSLSQSAFYDGLTFHKITPDFAIRGGDPRGDGTGGPGYNVDAEFNERPHEAGVISMSRVEDPNEAPGVLPRAEYANSAGSQFFICLNYANTQQLDHRYTAFGKVIAGMDAVNAIAAAPLADEKSGKPKDPPKIKKITVKGVTAKENPYPLLFNYAATEPTTQTTRK
jgi:peptidyl-prolyl cis-trans isomerase B (cyclophilin B)